MSKDIYNMRQAMEDFFNDTVAQKEFEEKLRKEQESYQRLEERARKIFEPMSSKELKEFMPKFFSWNRNYQDRKYNEGIETHTTFIGQLFRIVEEDGTVPYDNPKDTDFMANRILYKGFIFELFVGQGSFWRIYHIEDETLKFNT